MKLNQNITEQEKQQIFQSYCQSFPADERRNDEDFWHLFNNSNVEVLALYKEQNFVGYFIIWHLSEFVFVEHFEIFESFRQKGLGSEALKTLVKNYPLLILETEPESLNDVAKKRVHFYQKNGFFTLKEDYIQPSYSKEKNAINLWLMGNFSLAKEEFLIQLISKIYNIVYAKN